MRCRNMLWVWIALILAVLPAGCDSAPQPPALTDPPTTEAPTTEAPALPTEDTHPIQESQQQATLYIGTQEGGFARYPLSYTGELAPEILIDGLEGQAGWHLPLDQPVTSGKGGMTVCFAPGGTLFADGLTQDLAHTLLDSLQKTLQMAFITPPGRPEMLDIYYCEAGDQPLTLPAIGKSWPLDLPYQWQPNGSLQNIPFAEGQA